LDGYGLLEPLEASAFGAEDLRHTACSNPLEDPVTLLLLCHRCRDPNSPASARCECEISAWSSVGGGSETGQGGAGPTAGAQVGPAGRSSERVPCPLSPSREALISAVMSDDHAHDSDELELDPDEPHTPWWMPLLGGFLFLMAALGAVI